MMAYFKHFRKRPPPESEELRQQLDEIVSESLAYLKQSGTEKTLREVPVEKDFKACNALYNNSNGDEIQQDENGLKNKTTLCQEGRRKSNDRKKSPECTYRSYDNFVQQSNGDDGTSSQNNGCHDITMVYGNRAEGNRSKILDFKNTEVSTPIPVITQPAIASSHVLIKPENLSISQKGLGNCASKDEEMRHNLLSIASTRPKSTAEFQDVLEKSLEHLKNCTESINVPNWKLPESDIVNSTFELLMESFSNRQSLAFDSDDLESLSFPIADFQSSKPEVDPEREEAEDSDGTIPEEPTLRLPGKSEVTQQDAIDAEMCSSSDGFSEHSFCEDEECNLSWDEMEDETFGSFDHVGMSRDSVNEVNTSMHRSSSSKSEINAHNYYDQEEFKKAIYEVEEDELESDYDNQAYRMNYQYSSEEYNGSRDSYHDYTQSTSNSQNDTSVTVLNKIFDVVMAVEKMSSEQAKATLDLAKLQICLDFMMLDIRELKNGQKKILDGVKGLDNKKEAKKLLVDRSCSLLTDQDDLVGLVEDVLSERERQRELRRFTGCGDLRRMSADVFNCQPSMPLDNWQQGGYTPSSSSVDSSEDDDAEMTDEVLITTDENYVNQWMTENELQSHLDDYNDRKDKSNSSSTDSSTHGSRQGSIQATSTADWRLEPEELQHVLERVKAEREREDRSSTHCTGTRRGSKSLHRPHSWNGMTDSGVERASLESARQMGMIKPQHAGGQGQDRFLETHLDFVGSSNKLPHSNKTGERKDYSPGSPTELDWPSPQQGFIRKKPTRHSTEDVYRNGNQQHLSGITITVDSSGVVDNNNQITVNNHKTRSLPYSTGSSGVFENFDKGSDHLEPRCSTPAMSEDVSKDDLHAPVQRRRSNSLSRAIDEGRLDIADEADLRPLDIENDFHLISQITEMNQKMLLNQSLCNSPQNGSSMGEKSNYLSSSTNCLNRHLSKPTQRWSFIKESKKAGQKSAPASTRVTPVGTPLGSPGLKHKSLRPTKDSYSTLTRVMDYRQRAGSTGQSDVERRTPTSRSKEKRKKIQSLLLDQSKSYQSNIGISSPDLLGTQQYSGSRTTVDGASGNAKFVTKFGSLQRSGQRLQHMPVQKMYSDSVVDNNRRNDWPQKTPLTRSHQPLVRVSGVGRDSSLRSSYSENDGLSEKMADDRRLQMETNLEDSSDSSSLTSFESSIGNLSIYSHTASQPTSTDISIERCDKTDVTQKTSPVAKINISTAVVIRRPKGRQFQRPKSTPNFDCYRIDSASSSSRESSRNMEEEKPPLKARAPKPRRAPRRSKSDLGGKNTIKAALKAAERAAMKEAAEQDAIEKAANEIFMNAGRLIEKEQSWTLTRRSSGSSMLTNGTSGEIEETEKDDVVVVRRNHRRGLVARPISDLGPMNFDFSLNGESTPPRNRKASVPAVLQKVDSSRTAIKRSQSTPDDLDKNNLCNVSNQLKSNGTTDRHPDVIPRHSLSTDTLAEDMCITTMNNMAEDDVLVYGEALWDHVTMDEDELAFKAGDVIGVTDMQDKEWWWGQVDDQEGWFPASFVRIRVNQNVTVEEHFEKMSSGQTNLNDSVRRTSMSFLSKRQVRTNVVLEILNTEKVYNKHLKDLCEGYVKQARKRPEMFSEEIIRTIFGNIEEIYVFQCKFLRKLAKRINQEEPHKSEIGSCFLKYKDGFSIYAAYCSNHSRAITELRQLLRRQRYKHFFEACRLLQAMIEIRIDGFLLTPVQRICKYPLQLAELLKYTCTDHPDYDNVKQALETMRNVAFDINEQKRLFENIAKIAQWQKSIEGWEGKDVLEVSTQSLHSGEVFKVSHSGLRRTGRVLFLFDHQLILCKRDILWRSQLVYKSRINLDSCSFQDVVDTKDIRNAWKIVDHEFGKTCMFCTKSPEEKQKWLKAFHRERGLIEEEERGIIVPSSAREAAMKNAALTEKPIKPSDTLLKRKVPLMPYEYQHEIIKPNVKRMVLPRGISSTDGSEVDTSKRRLLNWFFKGKR